MCFFYSKEYQNAFRVISATREYLGNIKHAKKCSLHNSPGQQHMNFTSLCVLSRKQNNTQYLTLKKVEFILTTEFNVYV